MKYIRIGLALLLCATLLFAGCTVQVDTEDPTLTSGQDQNPTGVEGTTGSEVEAPVVNNPEGDPGFEDSDAEGDGDDLVVDIEVGGDLTQGKDETQQTTTPGTTNDPSDGNTNEGSAGDSDDNSGNSGDSGGDGFVVDFNDLLKCKKCGKKVNLSDPKCPHCGAPRN